MRRYSVAVVLACCIGITWAISNPPRSKNGEANNQHFRYMLQNPAFDNDALWEAHKKEFDQLPVHQRKIRLHILAKSHDTNNNGVIEVHELTQWILESFRIMDRDDTRNRIEIEDMNGDRKVSMDEIIHKRFGYTEDEMVNLQKAKEQNWGTLNMIQKERSRFIVADLNNDGLLDETEYFSFQKPQYFEHMHKPVIEITLKDFDENNDGLVSRQEFTRDADIEEIRKSKIDTFDKLDTNHDDKLTLFEIRPLALSEEDHFAEEEALNLILTCDNDKDGRLSIMEILSNENNFVENSVTDFGRNLHFVKDEL